MKIEKKKKKKKIKDSMGYVKVPIDALYGPQTQRAIDNFPISNIKFTKDFIYPIVIIKRSAAIVNQKLKLLNNTRSLTTELKLWLCQCVRVKSPNTSV